MATQNLLANAAGNTVGGASRAALSGGSGSDILLGGLTSGAGSLAGGYTSNELKDAGVNSTVANALGKATGAATATTIAGKDAKLSFINSLINTTLAESGNQVSSGLKSAWNEVNSKADTFNEELAKAKETYETKLTPLEQEAKTAQEAAASTYDEYKAVRDKFDSITAEYNAAKEAGDTDLANSLADKANALIPELNDVTTKYNDTVAVFDEKLATYNTAADEYKIQTDSLNTIKSEYETKNEELQQATEQFTNTALKVADMGDNSKALFEQLYNTGTSLEDAFKTVSSLDELKDPAQEAFIRQYVENNDPTAAFDLANKVNSLGENELSAYSTAVKTGLDDDSAMQLAPNISGMSAYAQNAYLNALRDGADEQSASTVATFAEMFGDPNAENPDLQGGMLPESTDVTDNGDYNGVDYSNQNVESTEEPTEGSTSTASSSGNAWLNQLAKLKIPTGSAAKTSTRWSLPAAPAAKAAAPAVPAAGMAGAAGVAGAAQAPQETFSGIQNLVGSMTKGGNYDLTGTPTTQSNTGLTPGLTQKMDYSLSGLPNVEQTESEIPSFAPGGSATTTNYDPFNTGIGNTNSDGTNGVNSKLSPTMTRAQINYILTGLPGVKSHADGGSIENHNPTFFSEGGLGSIENRYVQGEGNGTSDSIAAMLANGEFVIPADVVSKIGNGSNEAGAGVLDQFLVEIRKHAQSNGTKLPPESKGPLGYLLDAKRKVKA